MDPSKDLLVKVTFGKSYSPEFKYKVTESIQTLIHLYHEFDDDDSIFIKVMNAKQVKEDVINTISKNSNSDSNPSSNCEFSGGGGGGKHYKRNKNRKRKLQEAKDLQYCLICKESRRDILFTPCNHVTCCEKCKDSILDKCILCNSVIQNKIKVYF
jgi:hypothetical protein